MMDFDAATTLEARLKALDGILKLRRLVMDMVGWPKPPTMRPGKMPAALEGVDHNPLGDIDVETLTITRRDASPRPDPAISSLMVIVRNNSRYSTRV